MKPKFTKEEKKLIGRRIRDARNAEKLTLEQLAEKCECSSKHIGDVERGTVSASWPSILTSRLMWRSRIS